MLDDTELQNFLDDPEFRRFCSDVWNDPGCPDLDPLSEALFVLERAYEHERKRRDKDDPILDEIRRGIQLFADRNGIEHVSRIC
ncbi:MAG: hypothetical protein AAF950_07165 [Pseudomonadota bacterium]